MLENDVRVKAHRSGKNLLGPLKLLAQRPEAITIEALRRWEATVSRYTFEAGLRSHSPRSGNDPGNGLRMDREKQSPTHGPARTDIVPAPSTERY